MQKYQPLIGFSVKYRRKKLFLKPYKKLQDLMNRINVLDFVNIFIFRTFINESNFSL